jgi:uncharacterized membrane protein
VKLLLFAVAIATYLVALKFWAPNNWISLEIMVGAGLVLIVATAVAIVELRHRQRGRLTDMRDSALW